MMKFRYVEVDYADLDKYLFQHYLFSTHIRVLHDLLRCINRILVIVIVVALLEVV